jgi:hypothetical protein
MVSTELASLDILFHSSILHPPVAQGVWLLLMSLGWAGVLSLEPCPCLSLWASPETWRKGFHHLSLQRAGSGEWI